MTLRTWLLVPTLVVASACGDDDPARVTSTGGGGGGEPSGGGGGGIDVPPAPDITWSACPASDTPGFACADVPVPLDWSNLEGASMLVRIRRHEASTDPPRGSVWMLEGGPGAPGSWILPYALDTAAAHPDLDVLVVEHRGTGTSGPLICTEPTDPPTASCLDALLAEDATRIAATSTTASARDVATIARWFGRGDAQLLYGRSYGTYWAHRVVSVDPGAFDAVILDSPCDAVAGCPAAHRDVQTDAVARSFLARCDADPVCAAKLTGGAIAFAENVVAAADAGACQAAVDAGLTGTRLRLARARRAGARDMRSLAPALLHRVDRCSAEDAPVFAHLSGWLDIVEGALAASPDFSLPTNYHVMRSEFWEEGATVAGAEAELATTIAASGASVRWAQAFAAWPWPVVEVDPALHSWALESVPALVISGGLDSSTPASLIAPLESQLAAGSSFVRLEYATHVASAYENPSGACARTMIDAFLDAPGAPLDSSCIATADAAELATLFAVDESAALQAFGTASAYGD
ncbi:MAG: hypothetical protein HOV80_06280 [Polyangiaceae bacterium]|nr:hypothetical protein [Polyangiaceae bacterium]